MSNILVWTLHYGNKEGVRRTFIKLKKNILKCTTHDRILEIIKSSLNLRKHSVDFCIGISLNKIICVAWKKVKQLKCFSHWFPCNFWTAHSNLKIRNSTYDRMFQFLKWRHFCNPQGWAALLSYWAALLIGYIKSQYFWVNVRVLTHSAVFFRSSCG